MSSNSISYGECIVDYLVQNQHLKFFSWADITGNLVASFILILVYLILRLIIGRVFSRLTIENGEAKRKLFVYTKNTTSVLFFIALVIIWAGKLESFALSLAAVAAAIAISFKEYFLCLLGGVYKSSSKLFKVGDRIEINQLRGDVVDHDFLTTTLLEIGPGPKLHQFTGRTIVLPNSQFLTNPMVNETSMTTIGIHSFEFPAYITDDLETIEKCHLDSAMEVSGKFIVEAERSYRRLARAEGLEEPNVRPRVSIFFPKAHRVIFVVRFTAPVKRKGKIEQEIVAKFLKRVPKEAFSSEESES